MYTVKAIEPAEFKLMSNQWSALLEQSEANQLFMSWEWLYTWWETWSEELGLILNLLAAYQGSTLVGLMPLYQNPSEKRLEFIGNAWRSADTVRTEYCSSIVSKQADRLTIDKYFVDYILASHPKHDVILTDSIDENINVAFKSKGHVVVERERNFGVKVTVAEQSFPEYLSHLSSSTRRRLYNKRSYIKKRHTDFYYKTGDLGKVAIDQFFEVLNGFHIARWGKPCFEGRSLVFHKMLIDRLEKKSKGSVKLSQLFVGGTPISAIYDLRVGNSVFNIQSGYVEKFSSQVSLGLLHLGYEIENAFVCGNQSYDFLIGSGKNSFYKSKLSKEIYQQCTYHVVSNAFKKVVFSIYFNSSESTRDKISSLRRLFKI